MWTHISNLKKIRTERAGVIPYVIINDNIYFLLGIDRLTKELTDFGGGVKIFENTLGGAIREFKEETNTIFGNSIYCYNSFANALAITDKKKMTIIFLRLDPMWFNTAKDIFDEKKQHAPNINYKEIDYLIWVHKNRFNKILLFNNFPIKMWKKIQNFLHNNISYKFYELLK